MAKETLKEELIGRLIPAIYQNSTAAVFFHTAMAEQIGLGATEEKTLFMLSEKGFLKAGEIAEKTGLKTSSVTSLIDRLEYKGFVRRIHDKQDRRSVIVELDREKFAELIQVFNNLGDTFSTLLDGFSEEQLETIYKFLTHSTEFTQNVLKQLQIQAAEKKEQHQV